MRAEVGPLARLKTRPIRIIAESTNMGLVAIAESAGVSTCWLDRRWYFRPETLAAANAAIVNYHHRLPHRGVR
jgi:hypothetical protein